MNWLDTILIIANIVCIIIYIVCVVIAFTEDISFGIGVIFIGLFTYLCIALFILFIPFVKLDFASGTTIGTVTSVDSSMWGNKYIYLKTTENNEERYCIDKSNTELINNLSDYVGKNIKITYGKQVGLYSTGKCPNAPIETIEEMENK